MADLHEITRWLDENLRTRDIPDYPGALNGLQLENSGRIDHIVAAVDASLPVISAASATAPPHGLLLVHHGMFWQGSAPLIGPAYRKIHRALQADLAIYSSHLPLDVHPLWGNNILLAQAIGLENPEPFFEHKGIPLGLRGTWSGNLETLQTITSQAVGGPVHLCPAGPESIHRVAIITGGAGSEVAKVAAAGVDAFITGEGPHWSYPLAEECGIHLLYAGHYATETFGVRALAAALSRQFHIPWHFHDHPTGL